MTRADEAAWREYVAVEIQKFYDHCDGETYIWAHTEAAARVVARLGGDSEQAAFRGPWHVIRKHLMTEFRQWVEEYEGTERLTPTEWRAQQIAERAEVAFTESAHYTLGQLEELRRLTAERDHLIVEAAQRGATKVAIARAVGLSRQQVHSIVTAAETTVPEYVPTEWVRLASGELVETF
jgi:hypothetical protein